jgi:hypothetical protein
MGEKELDSTIDLIQQRLRALEEEKALAIQQAEKASAAGEGSPDTQGASIAEADSAVGAPNSSGGDEAGNASPVQGNDTRKSGAAPVAPSAEASPAPAPAAAADAGAGGAEMEGQAM